MKGLRDEVLVNKREIMCCSVSLCPCTVYKNVHVNLLRQLMVSVPDVCKDHLFLWTERLISSSCEVGQGEHIAVEPPHNGHTGSCYWVHCREVVHSSEVLLNVSAI